MKLVPESPLRSAPPASGEIAAWTRIKGVVQAEMAPGEIALLNLATGQYHVLNETGSSIWAMLERPCSVDALCEALCAQYDIDAPTCLHEVLSYLATLRALQLIESAP